ncbi:NAD(P)-dependent oxidoreductase, partial [Rhizobium sp. CG5]|uniref:NAD(P)-dependent oxidoreductase n=1 Tax=Rhizobium sp. CG5 TaxID=2726076 RepID=UPI00254CF9CB
MDAKSLLLSEQARNSAPARHAPARMAPLAKLPVFWSLAGKRVIVAGGSDGAAWKAELLAACGAEVHVYCTADEVSEVMRGVIGERVDAGTPPSVLPDISPSRAGLSHMAESGDEIVVVPGAFLDAMADRNLWAVDALEDVSSDP